MGIVIENFNHNLAKIQAPNRDRRDTPGSLVVRGQSLCQKEDPMATTLANVESLPEGASPRQWLCASRSPGL